jgi:ribonuclease HI
MNSTLSPVFIYCDGGARGNPGPAAIGFVVSSSSSSALLFRHGRTIGINTNNQAEYLAVIEALSWLLLNHIQFQSATLLLDSKLVVEQLNKNYRVKHPQLLPLFHQALALLQVLPISVAINHIPRSQNTHADAVVNQLLDALPPNVLV